jgi:hypothetical protein
VDGLVMMLVSIAKEVAVTTCSRRYLLRRHCRLRAEHEPCRWKAEELPTWPASLKLFTSVCVLKSKFVYILPFRDVG